MLLNMSRPPSIPSHSGPPSTYSPYPASHALASRPELVTAGQQNRPREPNSSGNNTQQLPSLRTLLEPELLDKKSSDASQRPGGGAQFPFGNGSRYDSSSPTLKRRHDFDSYARGYTEHNVIARQTSYLHRQPVSTASIDTQTTSALIPVSIFGGARSELQRRESFAVASHYDVSNKGSSLTSITSDPIGALANHSVQDEFEDANRPVRRRLDGASRAPVRQSRLIGQREVPGEGPCYIYEDGTYCRAIIDGEPVNPSWGITKAGKPRKRLAQACFTCREKKIKCEPGFPKCHQCAKSQRVCRGGLNQAGMSNGSGETSPSNSVPLLKNPSIEFPSPATGSENYKATADLRDSVKKVDSCAAGTPLRPRSFRPNTITVPRDMSVQSFDSDWSGSANDQGLDELRNGSYPDQTALQWEQDPFETDPRLTLHLLDLYFLHAGHATYGMFPRRPFLVWVESHREKNQDLLMLLYSVLAMGSLFSTDPDKRVLGRRFACIAAYAAEKRFGKFSLQLCQTRLLLALYFFALGKSQEAWDFCGSGLRAISALKLNTEEGVRELAECTSDLDYGFDRWTFEECCRRTFWSGLLMDRYNGFFGGTLFHISIDDAFIRLPCPDNMYEASSPCESSCFNQDIWSGQPIANSNLGDMAYLCLITELWGDVLTFTERALRRPDNGYERRYESFYREVHEKLDVWHAMLPPHLRYNPQNLDTSILEGYAGTFISIHALYHATIIRLNRHVCVRAVSAEKICRNVERAVRHASTFVSVMHTLAAINHQQRLASNSTPGFMFSTPFPSYALMLSIDTLTSAGAFATLPNLIETIGITMSCMDDIAGFWASARPQQKTVASRLKHLTDVAAQEGQGTSNGHGPYWKIAESLETTFGDNDVLYKADDHLLFDVIGQFTIR